MQVTDQYASLSLAETIVMRIINGDKQAEQELVAKYYRGLLYVLNRQTKNVSLSEDIAQDTFIVVIQKARSGAIQNPVALASFVRQTGINILIAHFRKETRRDTHGVEDIDITPPPDGLDISHVLYSEQMLALTNQMLNELNTPRDQQILRNYFVYEQSKTQICQELDLSQEHFDRVLFRARQRLKQLIQHKIGDATATQQSTLLNLALLLSISLTANALQSSGCFFVITLRDKGNSPHLIIATPQTSSRYMPDQWHQGKPLKPESRCV